MSSKRFLPGSRLRTAMVQGIGLGLTAAVLWWLARNTAASLEHQGISLGFGFLNQPASFDIGDTPLRYGPEDTFRRAIFVGLVNTALVSTLGWFLSVGLGFALGVMRLSHNPPLRGLVRVYVEVIRNTPLLLLLLFLSATMHTLPSVRAALEPLPGFFFSNRGLSLPHPVLSQAHVWLAAAVLGSLWVRRRLGRPGWLLLAAALAALIGSVIASPPGWVRPQLTGFNFVGGVTISPEFGALLGGLVLHHAAHVSEAVRGAVLAVPRGQTDAALALGLSRVGTMRWVVVPQALRAMVPVLATNCVSLTKNSSLAVAIGFPDVVSILNTAANQTGHAIENMLIMIGVYLSLSLGVAAALNWYNATLLSRGR